ncbi:MAG: hypothetical protein ACRDY7_01150 [Acidimicrobiia bacterium]
MTTRRRPSRKPRNERVPASFWGDAPPDEEPPPEPVRLSADPAALVRSLGEPPLGRNPAAALGHLSVVYEEAVRAAVALAAANGLLADDDEE